MPPSLAAKAEIQSEEVATAVGELLPLPTVRRTFDSRPRFLLTDVEFLCTPVILIYFDYTCLRNRGVVAFDSMFYCHL